MRNPASRCRRPTHPPPGTSDAGRVSTCGEVGRDEAIESSRDLVEAPISHMDAQIMMIDADEDEASQFDGNLNEFYLIKLSLAIVANLLLEFSPSKEVSKSILSHFDSNAF